MEDLIYRAILVLAICLAAWLAYRWLGYDQVEKEYEPWYFDMNDPKDQHEVKCILEQRKSGRELGPVLILVEREAANDD